MKKRSNIILFLTDQHNPKISGYAGDPWINTPTLDELANEGIIFDNAYCQSPLCVPSRSSMVTGQYCKSIGIYDNRDILPSNTNTYASHLTGAGYRTCLIGKAHANGEQFQGFQQRPFGDFYGQAHQPDPKRLPENYEHGLGDIPTQAGPSGIPLSLTQTEICVSESTKWLSEYVSLYRNQPFLLSVNFDKPHFPINPPRELFEKYDGLVKLSKHWQEEHGIEHLNQLSPFVRSNFIDEGYYDSPTEAHLRALAAYYGCIEWVDNAIGRILEVVKYLDLLDDTFIVYASDHGEMASAHGAWQKMVFYEESVRVPLIIRPPKNTQKGKRVTSPVGLIDLFPTFCDIASTTKPKTCEGKSLKQYYDEKNENIDNRSIFSESVLIRKPEHAGCMIRKGFWKYILYLDGNEELYNLETDPNEKVNLVKENVPDIISTLREELREFWQPEEQLQRYNQSVRMPGEKHFYPYSNQFINGGGIIYDSRP